jgi:hypothetical protein
MRMRALLAAAALSFGVAVVSDVQARPGSAPDREALSSAEYAGYYRRGPRRVYAYRPYRADRPYRAVRYYPAYRPYRYRPYRAARYYPAYRPYRARYAYPYGYRRYGYRRAYAPYYGYGRPRFGVSIGY